MFLAGRDGRAQRPVPWAAPLSADLRGAFAFLTRDELGTILQAGGYVAETK